MKMKLLRFALAISSLWFFSQNLFAQGGTLPVNNSVNGNLTSSTPDVWNITVTGDGFLRFTFHTLSPADLYITLYDTDGSTAISSTFESYNNSTITFGRDGLASGNYHVKITPYSTDYGSYTLADSFFVSPIPKDAEPNGTRNSALVLPMNSTKTGHVGYYYNMLRDTADWYKVTTNADGLLRVTLASSRSSIYSNNPLDVNVTLYDNNGTSVLGGVEVYNAAGPASGIITTDGLEPGTYYIKIQPYSTTEFADYTLSDSLFTSPLAVDAEPNGTRATALTLAMDGSTTGHVGYYYNNTRDSADWYKVTTNADGLLRVTLASSRSSIYSNNPLDVNVTLYDNNGTSVLGGVEVFSGNNPDSGTITTDGLEPGTYYVKVQPYSTNEFADYTLSDSLLTPAIAVDAEPNGTRASALTLLLNGSKTGHVGYYYNGIRDTTDWYKITTTADGLLRVYLTTARGSIYSNNPLDVNVTLYDNNGTSVLGGVEVFSGNNPASGTITTDGLEPGTYYVKVQPYSTNEFANYTISDSLLTPSIATDVEPNGTFATALTLPLNGSKTGHVGYYYNNSRDTSDWYKVTTTEDGLLRVFLTTARGSVYSNNPLDVNVNLYDSNGTSVLGGVEVFSGNNPASGIMNVDRLAAGTYYVKVQPYSTSEFADYTLSDSLKTYNPNDNEPDDSAYQATTLATNGGATGHVGFYYNGGVKTDMSDWFKINYTGTGDIKFVFNLLPHISDGALGDVFFRLYKDTAAAPVFSQEFYNRASNTFTISSLTLGDYWINIAPYSSSPAYFTAYAFTDSFAAVLPVTFINFDGVLQNDRAVLNWSTASEFNNKGFDVEKSMDGQVFNTIGFVKGNGNSSQVNNYAYIDNKVLSGHNYYRLKQIDIDGNSKYSSTIRLDFKNFDWKIFGDPVTSNSWLQLQLDHAANVSIQIISIDGKVLSTINKGNITEGTYSIPLNLGNAPSGVYVVKLIAGNQSFSKQVVK